MQACLTQTETELKIRNYSPQTIKSYLSALKGYLAFKREGFECVDSENIKKYLLQMHNRVASPQTVNLYLHAIKFFYREIVKSNVPIDFQYAKRNQKLPAVLTRDEVARIFAAVDNIKHRMMLSRAHGDLFHLYGVVSLDTGELIAGLAVLDVPEIRVSIHVTGFILPIARHTPAGVGLINHWFCESQSRGIRFCDFDGFFAPGDPISWKGFSRFKSQFGVRFVAYPDPFWRIAR